MKVNKYNNGGKYASAGDAAASVFANVPGAAPINKKKKLSDEDEDEEKKPIKKPIKKVSKGVEKVGKAASKIGRSVSKALNRNEDGGKLTVVRKSDKDPKKKKKSRKVKRANKKAVRDANEAAYWKKIEKAYKDEDAVYAKDAPKNDAAWDKVAANKKIKKSLPKGTVARKNAKLETRASRQDAKASGSRTVEKAAKVISDAGGSGATTLVSAAKHEAKAKKLRGKKTVKRKSRFK